MANRLTLTKADVARLGPQARAQIESQLGLCPAKKTKVYAPRAKGVTQRSPSRWSSLFVPFLIMLLLMIWGIVSAL